ncbi:MAG: HDOD domain-containing protein [Pseudomonadota bacterium]
MSAIVTPIDPSRLRQFNPLKNIPSRVLEYVAHQSCIEDLSPDSIIQTLGAMDNQICYLLQGDVETLTAQGVVHKLSAGTKRSLQPLSIQQPFVESVKAISSVTLLKLPRELYDSISQLPSTEHRSSDQAIQLDASDIRETGINWKFHEIVKEGKLELPSMPDIAMRIAKVVNNPDTDSEDIARVIQADPTVAARLISVVNSAAYRGQSAISSLPDAVSRLGRNVIHNLVISFALGSLFHSRSKILQSRMLALWKHACHVAAISHELGRVTPGKNADHALLCGLVHDIGALPIISAARSHPEISEQPEILDQTIEHLKAEVGAMVLRKWAFADDFIRVALHSEDWGQDTSDEPSYLDLVLVAQLHSYIGTPKMRQLPRLDLVPAFHKLALGRLTPRHSIGILENAKEQIRELQSLLSGS